jgi:hypothetical protein
MWASPAFPFDEDPTCTSDGEPTPAHVVALPSTKLARESDDDCAAPATCCHPAPTAIAANAKNDETTTARLRALPSSTGTIPWPADPTILGNPRIMPDPGRVERARIGGSVRPWSRDPTHVSVSVTAMSVGSDGRDPGLVPRLPEFPGRVDEQTDQGDRHDDDDDRRRGRGLRRLLGNQGG